MERSGIEVHVVVVDHDDRSDEGQPRIIQSTQVVSNERLARSTVGDLVRQVMEHTAELTFRRWRGEGPGDSEA